MLINRIEEVVETEGYPFALIPFISDYFSNILNILLNEFLTSTIIAKSSAYANILYAFLFIWELFMHIF